MTEKYRTIVADPPWEYERGTGCFPWRKGAPSGEIRPMLAYETLTVEEIAALPVADLVEENAHLYLWTTQRYLWDAKPVAEAWGFRVATVLTWAKPPTGFVMGGLPYGNATEFVLFCYRGKANQGPNRLPRDWFEWSRGPHSVKPDAFLDMVEYVSPAPRLELFARRARFGWDYWGDQSLGTAQMPALATEGREE